MGSGGIRTIQTIGHKKDIRVLGYGNTALAQALAPRQVFREVTHKAGSRKIA